MANFAFPLHICWLSTEAFSEFILSSVILVRIDKIIAKNSRHFSFGRACEYLCVFGFTQSICY